MSMNDLVSIPWFNRLLMMLDPERAHRLTIAALKYTPSFCLPYVKGSEDPVEVAGLQFPNRIGMSAGFDKNGDCLRALSALGFGFVEAGTVTPKSQAGNAKPRLFRLPKDRALINRMGFNNKGVEYLKARLEQYTGRAIVGANIGKNKLTPNERAVDDYLFCFDQVYAHCDYITINISSPNTPGLRDLFAKETLCPLLDALKEKQTAMYQLTGVYRPFFVKLTPDQSQEDLFAIVNTLLEFNVDGISFINTTVQRDILKHDCVCRDEKGGLSGKPLFDLLCKQLSTVASITKGKVPLMACGGVQSPENAQQLLALGADLIQVYSGFVYGGMPLLRSLLQS